jgi:hypothetical protein
MIQKISLSVLLCGICAGAVMAEPLPSIFGEHQVKLELHLERITAQHLAQNEASSEAEEMLSAVMAEKVKSPGKAFLLSALVPGLGEWYAGSKARSVLFVGIEALALGLYFNWNGEGNRIEDEFRATARDKWSPTDYRTWRNSTISRNSSITHALPCSSLIFRVEVETGGLEGLADCNSSEKQQYYELIGKYDQFISGWSDVKEVETGNLVQPTQVDSVEKYESTTRFAYEIRRDESNKFLKRASGVAGLILVNHVFSAIDASRVARTRNSERASLERRTRFAFVYRPWDSHQVPMVMAYKPF